MSLFDQFNWQGTRGFPYFWGYYWLGPTNPHALPPITSFVDTVTGATYYLILNTVGDHLQLTTAPPPGPQRALSPTDFFYMGALGIGLQVTNGHLTATIGTNNMPVGGPGPFAPNALAGIATLIGGLYPTLRNAAPGLDHISVQIGTIVAKTTPAEPTQIPPVVGYQGYYYELQDAKNTGKLT